MVDSRATMERAEEILHRIRAQTSPRQIKAHRRRVAGFFRRLKYALLSAFAVVLAAIAIGTFVMPLGPFGFLATILAMAATIAVIMGWPQAPEPTPQQMAKSELPLLPSQTERWLEAQRPALPAPAQRLADEIGIKLEAIGPRVAMLDPREPAAYEVRKLMAEELPDLIDGYKRVPEAMRRADRNGSSPDKQLFEGLRVVDEELGRIGEQLATADLDKLATQGRYLELKYRGEDGETR